MQDQMMQEIADLGNESDELRRARKAKVDEMARIAEIFAEHPDNREGRRAAQRQLRKRNGYTR